MLLYVIRRLMQLVPLLFFVSALIFFLLYSMPGDPLYRMLEGIPNLADRLEQFAAMRTLEGYLAEWRAEEDGFIFIENHCPICNAATKCANICKSELNTFASILGDDVEVIRTSHIIDGDRRCVYKISLIKEIVPL